MSVDLTATLPRPITLAAMLDQGRRTLSDLLAITAIPKLQVFADRRDQDAPPGGTRG